MKRPKLPAFVRKPSSFFKMIALSLTAFLFHCRNRKVETPEVKGHSTLDVRYTGAVAWNVLGQKYHAAINFNAYALSGAVFALCKSFYCAKVFIVLQLQKEHMVLNLTASELITCNIRSWCNSIDVHNIYYVSYSGSSHIICRILHQVLQNQLQQRRQQTT